MGRVRLFNGSTGLFPFTGGGEEEVEDEKPSRVMGMQALLLLLLLPPTNIRIESRTTTTAVLVWNNEATNFTLIEIDRALGDGAFANIAKLSTEAGTYTDTGLAVGTRYRYRLRIV